MSTTTTFPPPVIATFVPPSSKWEREYAAFQRLLPQLLKTHHGRFVAIHGEQVVEGGDNKLAVALSVLARLGNVDIHVGLVTAEPEPIARSGVRREIRTPEAKP